MTEKAGEEKGQQSDVIARFAEASERTNDLLATIIQENRDRAQAPAQTKAEEPPRVWTVAELQAMVDKGDITPAAMAQQLAKQAADAVRAELTKEFKETLATERVSAAVMSELARFRAAIPALNDPKSPEFKKAAKAYDQLRTEGLPKAHQTELAAMRIAFPNAFDAEEIEETTSTRVRSTESAGGSGGRDGEGKKRSALPGPAWLEPHRRTFYQKQIEKGRYSGWDDAKLTDEFKRIEKKRARSAA